MMTTSKFASEGGRFFLAEALFDHFKYSIYCSSCDGNPGHPGFIKDQAGKTTIGSQARRQWACQYSNSKEVQSKCPRVTCSDYIKLAMAQLQPQCFQEVLDQVCQQYPPTKGEFAGLRPYMLSKAANIASASPLQVTTNSRKRSATYEQSQPRPKSRRREIDLTIEQHTPPQATEARQLLTALINISQTWPKHLELLEMFLSSSPSVAMEPAPDGSSSTLPSLFAPSSPAAGFGPNPINLPFQPSSTLSTTRDGLTPTRVLSEKSATSPGQGVSNPPFQVALFSPTPSIVSCSSTPFTPEPAIGITLHELPSTIPCTYPDEDLNSPEPTPPSPDWLGGARAAKQLSQAGARAPRTPSQSLRDIIQDLCQQFRQANKQEKAGIRAKVHQLKAQHLFNMCLKESPELKGSEPA